ncbi:DUF465 domain-containing protein [Helicobacter sp. 13S00477-4]|uniref:YdcH family protein n=1 Tax=Helicobacter sp. 13S00477-4 TaxID=1905759 RepID=UPI000BA7D67F|nr:DUF465 domain-containing protein [Helicobacter sp. 13S00477-4]PAF50547.1 hypothetical protein BKH44_07585 [Helicobacter sp. 13S00477-4]
MFHEYRDEISQLKIKNAHFEKIFEEHNQLDKKIIEAEKNPSSNHLQIEEMKKLKLKLKDEIYTMIVQHSKSQK